MVNIPSVPEIITVNSEQLQTQIRDLLPSQNGFGSELQASNVITPIIDLTATAEGSGLPVSLQQALAFGSQTVFSISNTSVTLANSPGFYRITANAAFAGAGTLGINVTDGATTKNLWFTGGFTANMAQQIDFIVWLTAGETLSAVSSSASVFWNGGVRQGANSEGALVQPGGYPL